MTVAKYKFSYKFNTSSKKYRVSHRSYSRGYITSTTIVTHKSNSSGQHVLKKS